MKKTILIAGAALAVPLAVTLLLKILRLLQGIAAKLLSLMLWCLSGLVVLGMIRQTRAEDRARNRKSSATR